MRSTMLKLITQLYILLSATSVLSIRNTPTDVRCGSASMVIADTLADKLIGTSTYSTCVSDAFKEFDSNIRLAGSELASADFDADADYAAFKTSIASCASAAAAWFSLTTSAWSLYRGEECAAWREANPRALGL